MKTTTNLRPAIWFSRHSPTPEQVIDAETAGFKLGGIEEGMALGALNINDDSECVAVIEGLRSLIATHSGAAIFGVFPAPLMALIYNTAERAVHRGDFHGFEVPCFAAWNIARTPEGGRPTFSHKQWLLVGRFS